MPLTLAEMPRYYVVMGVAGCGKSTIGKKLAGEIGGAYLEGDLLHPQSNIDKMSAGMPLDDSDRYPWLDRIAAKISNREGTVFAGCSALKKVYRDRLRKGVGEPLAFLHLTGGKAFIAERMKNRSGHFMPLSLLDSQFEALEPLQDNETGIQVDINATTEEVVALIVKKLLGTSR